MTRIEAEELRVNYASLVMGKPIAADLPDYLIDEIALREITPDNYEVNVVATFDEGVNAIYRSLVTYIKDNNLQKDSIFPGEEG